MDLILELTVERLLEVIRVKFAEQGVAPAIQFETSTDQWVLNDVGIRNLRLSVVEMVNRSWNRPLLGPALDPFSFIPVQRVRGRLEVELGFATLASLRSHRPDASGPPPIVHRPIGVIFEPQLRVTSGAVSIGIDVQDVDQLTIPVPDSATEEQRRQIAEQEHALRDRAIATLRDAARGLEVALPVGMLGELLRGATRVLNAGLVAEPSFTTTGALDPAGTSRFLQVGIQMDRPDWILLSELQRAQLVIRKGEEWRRFHRSPQTRSFRWGFGIFLGSEALVITSTSIIDTSVASASDRLRLRGPIAGRWPGPDRAAVEGTVALQFPATALNACGTGHHLDADVRVRIIFSIGRPDQILIVVLLDYGVDFFPLLGCALEIASIAAFAGFVIGGVFGGPIGALVGAIAGFLAGFITVFAIAGYYRASLGDLPGNCIETPSHDVNCTFSLPPPEGDTILSALRLRNALPLADGLAIVGALEFPPAGPPPRIEATIFEPLHWYRGRGGWVMRGRVFVINVGGGDVVIGSVIAIGAGADLYARRISAPRFRLFPRASGFIEINVPWAEVEAARTAGTLAPAELLIFSTGGARSVQFADVPETLTADQMQSADLIDAARVELSRIGNGQALIGTIIPPAPDPRKELSLNQVALIQVSVRQSAPKSRWALATVDGQLLGHSVADDFGNVFISTITSPPAQALRLINLPVAAGKDLATEVKQVMAKGAAFADEAGKVFRAVLGNALRSDQPMTKSEPVIDVGLGRPALLSKVDAGALRKAVAGLSSKFGQRDQKLTVNTRVSLLAERQRIAAKSVGPLIPMHVDGETVLSTMVDKFPIYLSLDNAGGLHAQDASGAQHDAKANEAKTNEAKVSDAQTNAFAASQSLPEGFIAFSGCLIGLREGQLSVYAMIEAG